MKILLFATLLVFAASLRGHGQSGDGGSGWANFVLQQAKYAWEKADKVQDKLRQSELLITTKNLLTTYKETKQLTGTIVATTKDLKSLTEKFQNDLKTIDVYTKEQIEDLNEFISFKDELSGEGYQSLFGFTDWYEENTSKFRDKKGTLNISSTLLNTVSDKHRLETMERYNAQFFYLKKHQQLVVDMQIREHIRAADYLEKKARRSTAALNYQVFGNTVAKLGNQFKSKNTSASGEKKSEFKPVKTDSEIKAAEKEIFDLLHQASWHRSEAYRLFQQCQELQTISVTATKDFIAYKKMYRGNWKKKPTSARTTSTFTDVTPMITPMK